MLRQRALLAGLALALAASCAETPSGPPTPSPQPTPTPVPSPRPGILHGPYLLKIQPAPSCPNTMAVSFAVEASADDTARYPGIQGVDALPIPLVELEVLDGGSLVRGGVGTDGGIPSAEGVITALELVCTGSVSVGSDGAGEVLEGTASGFVEFGGGGQGTCKSPVHSWSLRRR
jgi:hypothetical protein